MSERAPVNRIIPFSYVDGPGCRAAVFLQGCDQSCLYCHNPETISVCLDCGECVAACNAGALTIVGGHVAYDAALCRFCDSCIRACTHGSSPRIRMLTAEDTMRELERYMPFIRGVTLSGGECTLHAGYIKELYPLLHEAGKTLFLDTNGQTPFYEDAALTASCDMAMIDLKAGTDDAYMRVCGKPMCNVIRNIRFMAERGRLYEIRTVIVPGLFDCEAAVRLGASLIREHPEVRYKLTAYRVNGVRRELCPYSPPSLDEMKRLSALAESLGVKTTVIS